MSKIIEKTNIKFIILQMLLNILKLNFKKQIF